MGAPVSNERMTVVIAGHVDHGKSTIIGRLLADTRTLPDGKLDQVRAQCERTGRPFEYAFLLDALRDEQTQGITIDVARVFFRSGRRHYLIMDAPGHVDLLKNMITGAARAEAALLVIDGREGVQENSRRHGYLLAFLGIRQVAVLVNKMDLVGYDQATFDGIVQDYLGFLGPVGLKPACFIPVCGRAGENVAADAVTMPWYTGPTVLQALDDFQAEPPPTEHPFRMPVQNVYKFARHGDTRRIVAGTVETGTLRVGDEVVFYPSGKRSRVATIEAFNRPPATEVDAGSATGFTLGEQVYVARGEIATRATERRPQVTTRLGVSLFWFGRSPLVMGKDYVFGLGSARVTARLADVHRILDAASLETSARTGQVDRYQVAQCVLTLNRPIACDLSDDITATSRFVLVDDFEICGGGLVREALPDKQTQVREQVLRRNSRWEPSAISAEQRGARYSQRPTLLLVTGTRDADRKALARDLETGLFGDGRLVYFLGIGNVLYGVDADIGRDRDDRREHMRRLAEVANIMLDAGVILIVTAAELTQEDLEIIRVAVQPDRIETIWLGDRVTTDVEYDLHVLPTEARDEALQRIGSRLRERGIVFRP
jgi:bifunctional enzyme CysN/CysC